MFCREHGQQLTDLANLKNDATNEQSELLKGFGMFGVVKEIGVDDEGLTEFYKSHFTYPLYKDEDLVFYNDFFGKRKLKLTTYNPFKMYKGYKDMMQRVKGKKLEGNLVGEGMVQGGIIIFGTDGKAKYAYEEDVGKELAMEDIVAALKAVQSNNAAKK